MGGLDRLRNIGNESGGGLNRLRVATAPASPTSGFSDEYWRNAFSVMQASNAIGNPELLGRTGLSIDVAEIMEAANQARVQDEANRMQSSFFSPMDPSTVQPEIPAQVFGPRDLMEIQLETVGEPGGLSMAEFGERFDKSADKAIAMTDVVTWPIQGVLMAVNSVYEAARPQRAEHGGDRRGDGLERLTNAFGGNSDWEGLHPDIQTTLWEPIKAGIQMSAGQGVAPNTGLSFGLASALLLSGNPDVALMIADNAPITPGQRSMLDIISDKPYTGEYEAAINPVERGVRQFVTETLFDPLMWIPGAGGFIKAGAPKSELMTAADQMGNFLSGAMVDPNTGRILPSWAGTELAGGVRPPTLGEYIGWGYNKAHNAVRAVLDPYGPIRRLALSKMRYGGAEAVIDLIQRKEMNELIVVIAERSGLPVEEVRAGATQLIEELLASDQFGLRNSRSTPDRFKAVDDVYTVPESEMTTSMSPEDRATLEMQRGINAQAATPTPRTPTYPLATGKQQDAILSSYKPESQTLVYMSPEDYLQRVDEFMNDVVGYEGFRNEIGTRNIDYHREIIDRIKSRIVNQEPIDALFLDVDVRTGLPFSEEGRHRAMAAIEAGVEEVPVIIFHHGENGWALAADYPEVAGKFGRVSEYSLSDLGKIAKAEAQASAPSLIDDAIEALPEGTVSEAGMQQRRMFGEPPEAPRGTGGPENYPIMGDPGTGDLRHGYLKPKGVGADYVPNIDDMIPITDDAGNIIGHKAIDVNQGTSHQRLTGMNIVKDETLRVREQVSDSLKSLMGIDDPALASGESRRLFDASDMDDGDWADILNNMIDEESYYYPDENELEALKEAGEQPPRRIRQEFLTEEKRDTLAYLEAKKAKSGLTAEEAEIYQGLLDEQARKLKNEVMRVIAEGQDLDYWDVRRAVEHLENPRMLEGPTQRVIRIPKEQANYVNAEGTRMEGLLNNEGIPPEGWPEKQFSESMSQRVDVPERQMNLAGTGGADDVMVGSPARIGENLAYSNEIKPVVNSIMNLQMERFRRGRISLQPNRAIYEAMPLRQLEKTLAELNKTFIAENTRRLAGVRVFQRAVKNQGGMRPAVYEAVSSIIEELPGFKGASREAIESMADLLYMASWDSLNVGPRAPLMRERAVGMLNKPLSSHLGYIKHVAADEMVQAFEQAAREAGWGIGEIRAFVKPKANMTRDRLLNELGNIIGHESTRQRGFSGSITQGNKLAAEGRMGFTWENKPGAMPTWKILSEGESVPKNWVPIQRAFETDLPSLIANRRIAASHAIKGVEYLDTAMNKFGIYSPKGRPKNAMSIFDLMSTNGNPDAAWERTFGMLEPAMQERIKHTYFPDTFELPEWLPKEVRTARSGDTARAVLKYHQIAQGKSWIQDMEGVQRIFWASTRAMSRYWKPKTLFPFVSYHFRNHYDDCVRLSTWFDEWTPGDLTDAFNSVYHGQVPPHAQEFIGNVMGKPAAEVTLDDVLYYARGEGAFESGMYWDEVSKSMFYDMGKPDRSTAPGGAERLRETGLKGLKDGPLHHPGNPFSTNFAWDQVLREFGMDGENMRRLSGFYAGMKEPGMDLERLGEKVRMVMIDYLDQDPTFAALREISPFIMFQRHAIPLNVRALFEKPGKVALRMRAYRQMDSVFADIYDREDTPPSWNNGKAYRVGSQYWWVASNTDSMFDFEDLVGSFTRFVGGDRAEGLKLVSEYLAPWFTEMPEQMANWDSYRNKPIYDRAAGERVPRFLTDMGLSERNGARLWHGITSTWRAARDLEGAWNIFTGEKDFEPAAAGRQAGFALYESSPTGEVHYLLKKNKTELEALGLTNAFGNWQVYDIIPDRYGQAAKLFGERIMTHLMVQEYLTNTAFGDDPRQFEEAFTDAQGYDQKSQVDMLERIQDDIRGIWKLQDQFEQDVVDGRVTESQRPFAPDELRFINNLNQSIILTKIALAMKAFEDGEITRDQMESRIDSRWDQFETAR